jgi:hypothetical protein
MVNSAQFGYFLSFRGRQLPVMVDLVVRVRACIEDFQATVRLLSYGELNGAVSREAGLPCPCCAARSGLPVVELVPM